MSYADVTNLEIMETNPMDFWQAIQMLRMHIASCQPNATHFAISEFAHFFR